MKKEWVTRLIIEKINENGGEEFSNLLINHPKYKELEKLIKKAEIAFSDFLTDLEVQAETIAFEIGFDTACVIYGEKPYFDVLKSDFFKDS